MLVIPVQAIPNQQLQVQLGTQACTLEITQTAYGLFMNVYVSGTLIVGGVLCNNVTLIVGNAYLGFIGDMIFLDTQGNSNPVFTGLGVRYQLLYLTPNDLGVG